VCFWEQSSRKEFEQWFGVVDTEFPTTTTTDQLISSSIRLSFFLFVVRLFLFFLRLSWDPSRPEASHLIQKTLHYITLQYITIILLLYYIKMQLTTTAILLSVGSAAAWSQPSRSSIRSLGQKSVVVKGPSRVSGNTMKMEGAFCLFIV
jgi:hypothetical protein